VLHHRARKVDRLVEAIVGVPVEHEIGRERNIEDRYVWNTPAADATLNLGSPALETRSGARALSRTVSTTADTLAAYLNDQIDLTPQWKLVAGMRGERFKVSSDLVKFALPAGFPGDTTLESTPKSETMFNPRAGVIYQPSDTQSYYLSYGTSSNPSAETVAQSASTAALDAEKNRSIEAGAKLDLFAGRLAFNAAIFHVEKTNARFRDGVNTAVQVLGGKIRVDGFELGITGNVTPAWQVFGGYTFLDGKILKSSDVGSGADAGIAAEGKRSPNTPRHNATLWTTARVAPGWEVGGGLLYSSSRTLNNYATALIDGYTRIDATLAYLQKSYELRINLQNLTDHIYFEGSSAGRATPVRGRSVLASVVYRF
jgi:catecholate siderophore receptor